MSNADPGQTLSPLKRALLALDEMKARLAAAEQRRNEPVAIIGLGCRIPQAPTPDDYWRLLRDGICAVGEVPGDRWSADQYYDPDPDAPGKMYTRHGAFLDRIDLFDPQFFGIAPREAMSMDPQQRLLLEVCWEALEQAGIAPDSLSGTSTGVFVGLAASDYLELVKAGDVRRIDAHFASGIAHSVASGRLAYVLGLQGPAVSIDTACSSSLVAVHLACQSLLVGDCRMALAGGVNVIVTPDNGVVFSKSRMLAPDGRCKTFDASADGFGRGEGCGIVVLKRLSDAIADGDRVLAVIPGSAVNQDGPSSGLTAPNGPAQEAVIRAALSRAGARGADVDFVEAHGTGTVLGDPIEIQALGAVFGERPADAPLAVGSVKTNIGHLEAAAGVAGLIKIVLALQHDAIPPHLHLNERNPLVEWEALRVEIPTTLRPWPRGGRRRMAGLSSFGFSGTNVHILVSDPPPLAQPAPDAKPTDRSPHLVTLSARSAEALNARLDQMLDWADSPELRAELSDVAFTANAGRAQFAHRAAVRVETMEDLRDGLRSLRKGRSAAGTYRGTLEGPDRPKVGFLFTGQGAQYAGMGRRLYESEGHFRRAFDECDEVLQPLLGRSLVSILYAEGGDTSLIDQTAYTQPAMFAVDYALAQLWRGWGVEPDAVIGHSLGEYVAACVAGVMSLADALTLVAARGRLMQALPANGAMASVFADEEQVAAAVAPLAGRLSIAAINDPNQTVISGEKAAMEAVLATLGGQNVKARRLVVSHAFHSPLMEPMLDEFTALAQRVVFSPPRIPVVSNVTGRIASAGEMTTADYWRRHVLAPVRFVEGIRAMHDRRITVFLEAGPHPTLLGLAGRCLPEGTVDWVPSLRNNQDDWHQLLDSAARLYVRGVRLNWAALDRGRGRRRVDLPTYPFERERYWVTDGKPVPAFRPEDAREGHPLLGRRLRAAVLREAVFEAAIDARSHPWVFEHRVHGQVILPGAAFFELGFAAAWAIWDGEPSVVEGLAIHAALVLDPASTTTVQVVVDEHERGHASFKVFSALDQEDAAWTLHAEGRLVRQDAAMADAEDVAQVRERCEQLQPADLYDALAARGLDLGPSFHGVRELYWKEEEVLSRVELPLTAAETATYRIHPLLLDNALQTIGAAFVTNGSKESFLPVGFDRAYVSAAPGSRAWAHARIRRPDASAGRTIVADVFIRNDDGRALATLYGLRLQKVHQSALGRAAINDWLLDIRWQEQTGRASEAAAFADTAPPTEALARLVDSRSGQAAEAHGVFLYDEALPQMEALSAEYVTAAFVKLGWNPEPGERATCEALVAQLKIVPAQHRLVERLLEILAEIGVLRADDNGWKVEQRLEPRDVAAWMAELKTRYGSALGPELTMLGAVGPYLADVLSGATDPLALLFPGGSAEMAEALYQTSRGGRAFNQLLAETVARLVEVAPADARLQVLEIGGGTGSTSSFVLPHLPRERAEYVFTDVSPAFTARAARKFAQFPFVRYQALDIERDPSAQGLAGQRFDIIVAANVLHATRDLAQTFSHVRQLLKPGGQLLMLEINERQRWIDLTFGLTDGWWRFEDKNLRQSYPLLSRGEWLSFLERQGFVEAVATPEPRIGLFGIQAIVMARAPKSSVDDASGRWLVVSDGGGTAAALLDALAQRGGECLSVDLATVLDASPQARVRAAVAKFAASGSCRGVVYAAAVDSSDPVDGAALDAWQRRTAGSALAAAQALAAVPVAGAPLTFVTRRAQRVRDDDCVAPHQAALWGLGKSIVLEHPEMACRCVDIDDSPAAIEWLVDELLVGGDEPSIALRGERRYVARLERHPHGEKGLEDYRLESGTRGVIDGLELRRLSRRSPGPGEVEIEVAATALNFADVMDALGVRPGGAAQFGGECAGRITAIGEGVDELNVGDDVVAIAEGSFATHVTCSAALVVRKPASLTIEQAVTVPIAFITARYALEDVARLRAGDRVLIHAAAGGVGLAAIQVAQRAGAEIFATAGSDEKRAYLRSLGVTHIFNSRSTEFVDAVLEGTGGMGVDVVLNSLAGDFIAATLRAAASGARFVEIGKTGWTRDQVAAARPDVAYTIVDWAPMARYEPTPIRAILEESLTQAAQGTLQPLPATMFAAAQPTAAFRFMAQARHIGKVVVLHRRSRVRDDATYLVTGGLAGLGLLTGEWLVEQGARSVVLLGRSGPTADTQATLTRLRDRGVAVTVVRGDVASADDMRRVFEEVLPPLPPLRGIIHSAGVLDDGVLVQQDWSRFERVMAPKVGGTWHLHERSAGIPLDFFVLFSSVAAVFGSAGQANHSAANSFMDALAHRRQTDGLPATSINWGAWSEIGAAVRHDVGRRVAEQGVGMIDPEGGLLVLERAIREQPAQLVVFPADWAKYGEQFAHRDAPALLASLLSRVQPATKARQSADMLASKVPELVRQLEATPEAGRSRVVLEFVRGEAVKVLGLPPSRGVDTRQPLNELGLDSLMAVELRNSLAGSLARPLPSTLLFDYPTIEALAGYIERELFPATADSAEAVAPSRPGDVVDELEELSDDEVDRLFAERMARRKGK